jgi:hypothetical protein
MLASCLLRIGYALFFLGGIWIIVLAWQDSIIWGLGCLFLPVLQLFYIGLNWKKSKNAFFLLLAGFGAIFISSLIGK